MEWTIADRWSTTKAQDWWDQQSWVCGFNYLPSTAVNFLEMWMADRFDRETIARELRWASDIGYNSTRINLHYLVWKYDRDGLLERLDWFLACAAGLGLSVMPVLFDDCGFGGSEPVYGPQPDPVAGIHNSRAVASPGRAAVMDRAQWPLFEAYVKDVLSRFASDPRVLAWDLYNEPGNGMIFCHDGSFKVYDPALSEHSRDLMIQSFQCAREVAVSQPLTVAAWRTPPAGIQTPAYDNEIDQLALSLSDIITFHAYCDREHASRYIAQLTALGRPMLSTEWMARTIGSRIEDQLALYHDAKVGCYHWGFVRGRTQTHLPWPSMLESYHGRQREQGEAPMEWFHDVLEPDGSPYDPREIDILAALTGRERAGMTE